MENLQIVSLNVRGLRNRNERKMFKLLVLLFIIKLCVRNNIFEKIKFQYFETKKFDLTLIHKTYSTSQDENKCKK